VGPGCQWEGKKKEKRKERGKGARAAAGLVALLGPGRGPVGLLLSFFCSFFIFLLWFLCFLKFRNILKTKILNW
jgi:hypothetical protein